MRYRIKTSSPEMYQRVLPMLRNEATVRIESERRLLIAAEDVDSGLCQRLKDLGASVSEDYQYVPDAVP